MYMWLVLKIQCFNFAFAPSADLHLHVIVNVPGESTSTKAKLFEVAGESFDDIEDGEEVASVVTRVQ